MFVRKQSLLSQHLTCRLNSGFIFASNIYAGELCSLRCLGSSADLRSNGANEGNFL